MKTLIIDDERLARQEMRSLLQSYTDIDIVGEAVNGKDALEKIEALKPELIFLDIQMPGMNGFELLEELSCPPLVVFVTAYDEHALKAFEVSALDYLLKPVEPQRLASAIEKVRSEIDDTPAPSTKLSQAEKVFLKDGDRCWFVKLGDISVFTSVGNYTQVQFETSKPLIRRSLNQLAERLPEDVFFRASRQHIINLGHIKTVDTAISGNIEVQMQNGESLELSRRQSLLFRETMSL